MPIEISCSKAVNLLREKTQNVNVDLITYRLSKILNVCQGYSKLQPRILPKGLSSLITPNNDDDDNNYYFHNRPQIKHFSRRRESMEETITEDGDKKVVQRKNLKNVKKVRICEGSLERTEEHTKEVTTHKFYKVTRKVMTLRRATKQKKVTEQHPIDATVKSRLASGVKSILRRNKSVDSIAPAVEPVVVDQEPQQRGLFKSRSVDVDTFIGKNVITSDIYPSSTSNHLCIPDETKYEDDGEHLEIVEGKASASPVVVVLKEDPAEPEEKMLQQLFPNMKPAITNLQHGGSGQRRKKSVSFTNQQSGAAIPSFLLTYQGGLLFTEDEIYAIPSQFAVLSSSDC